MLNKRHCSPAKGLKGGRHCALSPVLIVVVDDDDDDAGDDYDDEEEEEDVAESAERGGRSGGREYLPTNTDGGGNPLF